MISSTRQGLPPELHARLRRMALIVRSLVVVGVFAVLAYLVWFWVLPGHAHSQVKQIADVDIDQMPLHTRVAGGLWTLLPATIVLLGLQRLWRLFGEYAHGRVFDQRALASLRGFARCMLASALTSPIYGAVLSVIVTFDRKPGTRQINLQVDSNDYMMLLIGAVLLAVAHVMAEAARVAEDNAGFV